MASLMPSGAPETFTGANGSAPNATNVALAKNDGTGAMTVQSNQLRIRTGTTSGNRTSVRITGLSVSDGEWVFDWVVPNNLAYCIFMVRANSLVDGGHGYFVSLTASDMIASRHNPNATYNGPDLQTYTHGFAVGQLVRTRVAMFGLTIRARTWLQSNSEPTSTWQIQATDTVGAGGFTTAGLVGWSVASGSSVAYDLVIDNVDGKDTLTPTQATLAAGGSITMSGTETSMTMKRLLASISPFNVLTKTRAVPKFFTAAITSTGAVTKALPKFLTGTISPTNVLLKRANKTHVGSLTPAAALRKGLVRRFVGSIAPSAVAVVGFVGRVFGRPGLIVIRRLERVEVAIRRRKG